MITYLFILLSFSFLFSLFIGSFLGVVVDRLYRGEQFLYGRSHCDLCNHTLSYKDLIPVFSYLLMGGRCRYCRKKLSPTLPFFELVTAITITLFVYYSFINSLPLVSIILGFLVTIFLLLTFLTDLKYYVIFDPYLYGIGIIYILLGGFYWVGIDIGIFSALYENLLSHLISALWLAAFFAVLHYGSKKKAMGEGDIYLAFVLGLYLTFSQSIIFWFSAFLTGALIGVILLVLKKKKVKQMVPFGPFLVIGFVTAFIFGNSLVTWYLALLSR